jgi:hypothetical protein
MLFPWDWLTFPFFLLVNFKGYFDHIRHVISLSYPSWFLYYWWGGYLLKNTSSEHVLFGHAHSRANCIGFHFREKDFSTLGNIFPVVLILRMSDFSYLLIHLIMFGQLLYTTHSEWD